MINRITAFVPAWMSLLIILMIVFAYNLHGVNRYTIRRDELTTLGHIGALVKNPQAIPVTDTINSLLTYSSDHAPLYYMFINVWGAAFDFNYFALRFLSVCFGIIAIAATYRLGTRLAGHHTGLFAAFILGTNVLFYGNVHEMRDWTMLIMVSVLAWLVYWRLAHNRREPHWYEYVALFLLTVVSLYSSYLVAFLWITIGLHHLLAVPRNKRWWQISATVIAGGLAFLPWLPFFAQGLELARFHMDNENPMLLPNIELIQITTLLWGNGLIPLFVICLGLGLYASWKDWKLGRNIVFFLVMMVGGLLIVNEFFLFLKRVRYLIYLTVPFALLAGYGLAYLTHKKPLRVVPFALLGIWFLVGYQFTYTDLFNEHLAKDRPVLYPEYNDLVPILREKAEKNDLIIQAYYEYSVIQASKQNLHSISTYYMQDLKLKIVNFPLYVQWSDSGIDATPVEYAIGLIPQYEEFWFSYHHDRITSEIIEFQNIVAQDYTICETIIYGERSTLDRYVLTQKFDELCDNIQG